jgi:hypothetical protein
LQEVSVTEDRQQVIADFDEVVNMTPKELQEWLATDESEEVGQKDDGGESTGHRSGRRILEIQHKKKSDYTDDDLAHMRKVNGYVKRHLKQKPKGDVENSGWRYSLLNWGHDPTK